MTRPYYLPEPVITPDYIELKLALKGGQKELLRARGEEARQILNVLDQVFPSAQRHLWDKFSFTSQILIKPGLHNKQRAIFLVTLKKLCGACCLLPDSHEISDGLEIISASPVAGGGFADVYQGTYKGRPVAIKTLRTTVIEKDGLARIKKVQSTEFPP
jgi:hypothetical protein